MIVKDKIMQVNSKEGEKEHMLGDSHTQKVDEFKHILINK